MVGLTGIVDFTDNLLDTVSPYTYYFFARLNLLLAIHTDAGSSKYLPIGMNEISNDFADYYGYEWVKVYQG